MSSETEQKNRSSQDSATQKRRSQEIKKYGFLLRGLDELTVKRVRGACVDEHGEDFISGFLEIMGLHMVFLTVKIGNSEYIPKSKLQKGEPLADILQSVDSAFEQTVDAFNRLSNIPDWMLEFISEAAHELPEFDGSIQNHKSRPSLHLGISTASSRFAYCKMASLIDARHQELISKHQPNGAGKKPDIVSGNIILEAVQWWLRKGQVPKPNDSAFSCSVQALIERTGVVLGMTDEAGNSLVQMKDPSKKITEARTYWCTELHKKGFRAFDPLLDEHVVVDHTLKDYFRREASKKATPKWIPQALSISRGRQK